MAATYMVVESYDKKGQREVSVVPKKWIKGDVCYWPDKKASQYAKQNVDPKPNWSTFTFKLLKENIDTFELALQHSKNLEIYSNTESENEAELQKKRNRQNPTHRFFDGSKNFNGMYEAEVIKKAKKSKSLPSESSEGSSLSSSIISESSTNSPQMPGAAVENSKIPETLSSLSPTERQQSQDLLYRASPKIINLEDFNVENFEKQKQQSQDPLYGAFYHNSPQIISIEDFGKTIEIKSELPKLRQEMSELRSEVKELKMELKAELKSMFDALFEAVRSLSLQTVAQHPTSIQIDRTVILPKLPFIQSNDISELNDDLINKSHLMDQMIRHLKASDKVASVKVRVKNLLEALMTYSLATQYSWTGKAHILEVGFSKLSFNNLPQIQSLIAKTINYKSSPIIDESQIMKAMHDFFRRAPARKKCKKDQAQ